MPTEADFLQAQQGLTVFLGSLSDFVDKAEVADTALLHSIWLEDRSFHHLLGRESSRVLRAQF